PTAAPSPTARWLRPWYTRLSNSSRVRVMRPSTVGLRHCRARPFPGATMFPVRPVLIAVIFGSVVAAQEPAKDSQKVTEEIVPRPVDERRDQTLLRRVTENTYVHEAAHVSFTVPDGWKEIRPHRLNRKIDPRISSVLGIERAD